MNDNRPNAAPRSTARWQMLTFGCAIGLAIGSQIAPDRVWSNLLVALFYLVSLGLGGAVFVAMGYTTGAGWSVAFRRVPEAISGVLPIAGIGVFAVLAAQLSRYAWHPHGDHAMPTFWFKELWLEPRFFAARAIVCVLLWILFATILTRLSQRQDTQIGVASTGLSTRVSAVFLFVFAITFSIASVDWLMALEPMWFSTMWGVYQFSGMILMATLAVIVIAVRLTAPTRGPSHGIFSRRTSARPGQTVSWLSVASGCTSGSANTCSFGTRTSPKRLRGSCYE